MTRLFAIAVRNVLRNRRRSFFNALAMIAGVGVVVFLSGFFNGFLDSVKKASIEGTLGAVQVHRTGFLTAERDRLLLDMEHSDALMAKMLAVPGVLAVAPRIGFEGLVNNGSSADVVLGTAYDPAREYAVCPRRVDVEVDGPLKPGDDAVANIGSELARALELTPGASVTLQSAMKSGATNALDATVRGRIESPVPFVSKRVVGVPLAFAQRLLRMEGRVTEYAIKVDDVSRAKPIATALQAALGDDYEVLTWDERDPQAANFVSLIGWISLIVRLVLLALVLTFIVNTMLSAVYERVREIGTMLAVGVRRRQVLVMFLVEAMTLGFIASAVGTLLGSAVVWWLGQRGIMLQPPGSKPQPIFPFVTFATLWFAMSVSVGGAVVAALYPALKASRLRPVEALRAN